MSVPEARTLASTTSQASGVDRWGRIATLGGRWLHESEGPTRGRRAIRWALAVGFALAAGVLQVVIQIAFGDDMGYLLFLTAIILSAWTAGFEAGLIATIASAATAGFVLSIAPGISGGWSAASVVSVALLFANGVLVSAVTTTLRRRSFGERRARADKEQEFLAERAAHETAERSRIQLERLQAVTASLAQAATPVEVAEAILDRGMAALDAAAGGVSILDEEGTSLITLAARGYAPEILQRWPRYPLSQDSHLATAVKERRAIFLSDHDSWLAEFPSSPPQAIEGTREEALAIVPLLAHERELGALVFRFSAARDFTDGSGELIKRLADQCAQAMDRAIASEKQRQAREALEHVHTHLEFLAQASEVLGSNESQRSMVERVAHLAVPFLAQWCVIELLDADRPLVATSHADPSRLVTLAELVSIAPRGLGRWISPLLPLNGEIVQAHQAISDGRIESPRALALLEQLDVGTMAVAPVLIDGKAIGAVMLGSTAVDDLDQHDAALIQDLAARLATMVERVRLYETVSRFKTTVDASMDPVYMFDPRTLRLTYINSGAASQVGIAPAKLVGHSVLELHPSVPEASFRDLIRPLQAGAAPSASYTGTLERPDGSQVAIDGLLQCVRLPDGSMTMVLTARDISERIEVQAQLSRVAGAERRQAAELRAVLHAMREGVLVVDPQGRVTLANEAAADILGTAPADLEEVARFLDVPLEDLTVSPSPDDVHRFSLADGRWIEVSGYRAALGSRLVGSDEPVSSILVLRDVSRARAADQAREAFLGVLSHELRTPITTIFGYAKLMRRPTHLADTSEILADIEIEADRLYRIVEDLLALSRLEAGMSVEGEPLLLQHLCGPVLASEAQRWPAITFDTQLPVGLPAVFGEQTYVEQVLRNLLSNAAKYSPPGATVTVTGEATPTEVIMRVLDRGTGVSAEESERLFQLYYRSPITARQVAGAGIGLFVCRGLVTAMGGRIWGAPRAGGGSEFGFSLIRCDAPLQ